MLNLKQDVIRQLNNIYKLSFKNKFKEEIKKRINDFVSFLLINNEKEDILEKLNDLSDLVVLNNNKVQILTNLFFKKHKSELLLFFNPIWYSSKERLILTRKEIENLNNEIFNAYAERLDFEINEKIKKEFNETDNLISMVGLNYGKNKTRQSSIFPIDKNVIKKYFQGNLRSMIYSINYKLVELQLKLSDKTYFNNFNKSDFKETNLIIEEKDIKNKKKTFFINIGFKKTTLVKTDNKEQTKAFIQYAYLCRYLEEINELKE